MAKNSKAVAKNSKAVAKNEKSGTELQTVDKNFFETYGQQASGASNIVGSLLKFSKGDWLYGQDDDELKDGTKLAANMGTMMVGWVKWSDNKPVEQEMGLLSEGFQPKRRSELGDQDEDKWEVDSQGKARDPWQFSNYILLKPAGKKCDTDDLFTFTTSSRGGLNAVATLCKVYGKEMRTKPDQWPIVELGTSIYEHKEYGRIKTPVLKVVGWEDKKLFPAPASAE